MVIREPALARCGHTGLASLDCFSSVPPIEWRPRAQPSPRGPQQHDLVFWWSVLAPEVPPDYRDNLRWHFHPRHDCLTCLRLSSEMKPGSIKQCSFPFYRSPNTRPPLRTGYQLAHGLSHQHFDSSEPTAVIKGTWSHQPHSQCCHQYVLTTHQWLCPLAVEQPRWARQAHCFCTGWEGDSTDTNVKCKSVVVRRSFCFNKKIDLGSIQLWFYSVTTTATRSMNGTFFLKYHTRNMHSFQTVERLLYQVRH